MDLRKKRAVIYGLYHLGSVTAASLAQQFEGIVGLDEDVKEISLGKAPLFEPGLDALLQEGLQKKHLGFTNDLEVIRESDFLWVCFDTPVDEKDRADVLFVEEKVIETFPYLEDGTIVLISSQLPVGTVRKLQKKYRKDFPGKSVYFACSPENLRLGSALKAFAKQERIVIGSDPDFPKERLETFLKPFAEELLWVSIESAEMTKHALNTFLALCVTYTNELATICEQVGADAFEVEKALRMEPRVGKKAFIRPGEAFGGGTLARDVNFLTGKGKTHSLKTELLNAILKSNDHHKLWGIHRLKERLGELKGKKIALLGLAYKPETSSIRRSTALHLCRTLLSEGAIVQAYDPQVKQLPESYSPVKMCDSLKEALEGAGGVIIGTEWKVFQGILPEQLQGKVIIDQTGFLKIPEALTLGQS